MGTLRTRSEIDQILTSNWVSAAYQAIDQNELYLNRCYAQNAFKNKGAGALRAAQHGEDGQRRLYFKQLTVAIPVSEPQLAAAR